MIEYVSGDIFNSKADVIVNPVNLKGTMGKGLAKQFKDRYPKMFRLYSNACKNGSFEMGKLMLITEEDHRVLLFPTKIDWRKPSKLEYIEAGLKKLTDNYKRLDIESIAFPKLGCGNGGLDWAEVDKLINKSFEKFPMIDVYVYDNQESVEKCS